MAHLNTTILFDKKKKKEKGHLFKKQKESNVYGIVSASVLSPLLAVLFWNNG